MGSTKKPTTKSTKTTTKSTKKSTAQTRVSRKEQEALEKRRTVFGLMFILLTVLTVFSIFGSDGAFILKVYKNVVTFFIGYGIYVLPITLGTLAVYCYVPFKGNTSLRGIAFLTIPLLTSSFMQLVQHGDKYSITQLGLIITRAQDVESAGLVGGLLSIILSAALTEVGAMIILAIMTSGAVLVGFNVTPFELFGMLKNYLEDLSFEEDEEEVEYKITKKEEKKAQKEKQKEYNEKLREAKQRAYQEAKERAPVKVPRRFKNVQIDWPLHDAETEAKIKEEQVNVQTPVNAENTTQTVENAVNNTQSGEKKEIAPKADAWIVAEYERIKKAEEERKQKEKSLKEELENSLKQGMNAMYGEDINIKNPMENQGQYMTPQMQVPVNQPIEVVGGTTGYFQTVANTQAEVQVENITDNVAKLEMEAEIQKAKELLANEALREQRGGEVRIMELKTPEQIAKEEEQKRAYHMAKENTEIDNIIKFTNRNFKDEKEDTIALKTQVSKEIEEIYQQNLKVQSDLIVKREEKDPNGKTVNYEAIRQALFVDETKSTMKYEIIRDGVVAKPAVDNYNYSFPPITLLKEKLVNQAVDPTEELRESSDRLLETLASFGIKAEIIHIVRGPSISRFEITIAKGIKLAKLTGLSDDIALSVGATSVRIAAIPEKGAIGIEVPNKNTDMVLISEVLESPEFKNTTSKLSYALGKDITGRPAIGDIAKMPHMLVAGTTGSGKSVCVNSMLVSLLYKANPKEVKFIMIDPKMVELGGYNGIPHLLIPVVTDPKKAAGALNWAVGEMLRRYKKLSECNVKDIASYNGLMEKKIAEGDTEAEKMPQIVIVIDELADLMMISAKEVEESITRIGQMARAAGMHLVIATQRPSTDVITGLMKANIPSRISFAVSSQIESRIILDTTGAEKLIGKGDMLYNPLGASKPNRLQGCFITGTEVEAVVDYVKTMGEPDYSDEVLSHIENHAMKDVKESTNDGSGSDDEDELIEEAIDIIVQTGQASTSFLQRKLKVGYARASRMMDQIEDRGIVGASDGAKGRQILITKYEWQEMKNRHLD